MSKRNRRIVKFTPETTVKVYNPIEGEGEILYKDLGVYIQELIDNSIIEADSSVFNPDLPDSLEATFNVGGIEVGTTVGELRNKTFEELWVMALFKATPPIYTEPTASLNGTLSKIQEVDVEIEPVLTATFTQNDAGSFTDYELQKNNTFLSDQNPFTDTAVLDDAGQIEYKSIFTYEEGPVLNNSSGDPFPTGQILADDIETNTVTYNWVYPVFYGLTTTPNNIDVLQDFTGKLLATNYDSITIPFNSTSSDYLWFAVPSSQVDYTEWFVTQLNKGDIGGGSNLFASPVTLAQTIVFNNTEYKLYVSNFSTEVILPMTIS